MPSRSGRSYHLLPVTGGWHEYGKYGRDTSQHRTETGGNTLIELHRAGRVIGIISHVAELKERITSQIEVLPSKEGSVVVCSR